MSKEFNVLLFVAFGFCEYEHPESTLRCIRLLNNLLLGEQRLNVKVDHKYAEYLTKYANELAAARKRHLESQRIPLLLLPSIRPSLLLLLPIRLYCYCF